MAQHTNVDENGMVLTDNFVLPCPVCDTPNQFYDIGSYGICGVCGWEDDEIQYDEPDDEDGSNPMSLNQARKMWQNGESLYPSHPNPGIREKAS